MKSAVERRMEIVSLVNRDGKARVEDLAAQFNVSSVTIRSDLSFLEKMAMWFVHTVRQFRILG